MTKTGFGRFISVRRKHLGLTQAELAEKIGVSKSAIAKWETEGGLPSRDNLRDLAKAINVSVDEMHRVIRDDRANETDLNINVTPDVIATLESYGYKVIRPGEQENTEDS